MTAYQRDRRNDGGGYYGFAFGIVAGTFVGAGLALCSRHGCVRNCASVRRARYKISASAAPIGTQT